MAGLGLERVELGRRLDSERGRVDLAGELGGIRAAVVKVIN